VVFLHHFGVSWFVPVRILRWTQGAIGKLESGVVEGTTAIIEDFGEKEAGKKFA